MGTISDKLLYLNETKDELRDGINDLVRASNEIDEDDTFRSYVEPLKSIRDRLPRVEGEGENITLDDTIEARMRKTLNGNTSQVQYSGKNLFDTSLLPVTQNGITISKNANGDIILNGTPDFNDGYKTIVIGTTITIEAGTYSSSVANKTTGVGVLNGNGGLNFTMDDTLKTKSATISTAYTMQPAINIRYNVGTLTNFVLNPQLEKSATSTSYEPYCGGTPSPNPDYPQDIHSVSGDNEIEVCGKNIASNVIYIDQTDIYSPSIKANYRVLKDQYYAISFDTANTNIGGYVNYNLSSKLEVVGNYPSFTCDGTRKTFIAKGLDNAIVTNQSIVNRRSATSETGTGLCSNFMIEKIESSSGTSTTYEPYTGNTYPIYLPVENLFDKSGTIINGYFDSSTTTITSATSNRTAYCRVKPNTTYCISKLKSIRSWVGTSQNEPTTGTSISNIKNIGSGDYDGTKINGTITTGANDNYIVINYTNTNSETGDIPNIILDSIQVEVGTKANHYTPYGTTPITLNKIGNYQDYIYKSGSKWYKDENIKKTIYDGSVDETWTYYNGIVFIDDTDIRDLGEATNYNLYSNYFIAGANKMYIAHSTHQRLHINLTNFGLTDITNATQWKTWLSTHNLEVYFIRNEVNTEITDTTLLSQLNAVWYSQDGQTNISQENNDQPFWLEVDALKDSDIFH